jgi:hypothetical protein
LYNGLFVQQPIPMYIKAVVRQGALVPLDRCHVVVELQAVVQNRPL